MTTTSVSNPLLRLGSQGASVKELQELLNAQLSARRRISTDGIFGTQTETAVKTTQYRFFLAQDGVVGAKTWHVLRTRTLVEKPILRFGSQGDLVARVQQVLKNGSFYQGTADGDFGAKTQTAVETFQVDRSLSKDGIVGPNTWQALVELAQILSAV
ncbi:MAG: peptidoglycan-binding protein [Leptolyngbyaceae cyanobacterium RU_5_1]|nr:peptidoglycan-binding protein [Leptolyngbyaceae cyanobacterium RU_5_1]